MASGKVSLNILDASKILQENYEPVFTDKTNRSNFLLDRWGRKDMTGVTLRWRVRYGDNSSAGPYSESDIIPTPGHLNYTTAAQSIKQNWVSFELNGIAQAAMEGEGGVVDLLSEETEGAIESLKNKINTQMLETTVDGTGRAIDGMGAIISNTGTYAGIARASNTWWQSYVEDNAGVPRPLTIPLMQDVMTEGEKTSRNAEFTVALSNRKHWYDYGNLLTPDRRFSATEKLDGGWMAIEFEGLPFVSVPNMPAGTMYFLTESEWGYYVLQNFEIKPKGTNTDSDYFLITHYSNLICKDPGKQAKITDLS